MVICGKVCQGLYGPVPFVPSVPFINMHILIQLAIMMQIFGMLMTIIFMFYQKERVLQKKLLEYEMDWRPTTSEDINEINQCIEKLGKMCMDICPHFQDQVPLFCGDETDLDVLGFFYYEGIQDMLPLEIVELLHAILMGDILVKKFRFEWRVAGSGKDKIFGIIHRYVDGVVPLTPENIRYGFKHDTEDYEPPSYSEMTGDALEQLRAKVTRRKYY